VEGGLQAAPPVESVEAMLAEAELQSGPVACRGLPWRGVACPLS